MKSLECSEKDGRLKGDLEAGNRIERKGLKEEVNGLLKNRGTCLGYVL